MGIWSKLFGSNDVIKAGIDGIDAIVFTDEERSKAKQTFLKLYEPFKIAQRYLAVIFSVPYVLAWFITFIYSFSSDVTNQLELLNGDIGKIVLAIVSFYFLGGVASGILQSKK
jgi:hypothetical protein